MKKRKDGSTSSCAIINPYEEQKEKPRRPAKTVPHQNYITQPPFQKFEIPAGVEQLQDYLKTIDMYDEEDDLLNEARTNEEMFDENLIQAHLLMGKAKNIDNCVFFNACEDEDDNAEESNKSSNESEYEEGELV